MNNIYSEKNNSNYTKILLVSFIFLFSFFLINKSYASTPFINSTNLTNPPFVFSLCGACGGGGSENTIKQGYTPSSTVDLCTVVLPIKRVANPSDFVFLLRASSTGSAGGGGGDQATSTSIVYWQVASSSFTTSTATYDFTISPCITLTANTFYNFIYFQTNHSGGTGDRYDIGEDASANVTSTQGTLLDAYNTVLGNTYALSSGNRQTLRVYSQAQLPASITILYPNATTTGAFPNWIVQASGELGTIKINYSGAFSSFQDIIYPSLSASNYFNLAVPRTHSLGATTTLWTAQALLYDSSNVLTAQSDVTYFTFNPALSPSNPLGGVIDFFNNAPTLSNQLQNLYSGVGSSGIPFTDASSSLANCNALNFFSWGTCFVNGISMTANALFIPCPQGSSATYIGCSIQNQLSQQLLGFTSIFPFSVPMTLLHEVQNDTSSTPNPTTLALSFPAINNMNLTILTSSSITNAVGSTTQSTYFTTARALMYAATGIHMFSVILAIF